MFTLTDPLRPTCSLSFTANANDESRLESLETTSFMKHLVSQYRSRLSTGCVTVPTAFLAAVDKLTRIGGGSVVLLCGDMVGIGLRWVCEPNGGTTAAAGGLMTPFVW